MTEDQLNMLLRYINLRARLEAHIVVHQPLGAHVATECEELVADLRESAQPDA